MKKILVTVVAFIASIALSSFDCKAQSRFFDDTFVDAGIGTILAAEQMERRTIRLVSAQNYMLGNGLDVRSVLEPDGMAYLPTMPLWMSW